MKTYEFDLAVVGGGGAGIAAALKASEHGLRVVLLEKAKSIGGSTAMCRGIGAVGSKTQLADPNCDFTVADILAEFMRQTNCLADNALIYRFLSQSGPTVDWLQENGCNMDYVGNAQKHHIGSKFKTYFNWGPPKIREMRAIMQTVADRGGMLLTDTAAKELIMEKGAVAGLKAVTGAGEEILIRTPAVALCSGGYGNNEEMVLKATKGVKVNMINSGGQTGDGINMGLAAGAASENLEAIEYHGVSLPFDKARSTGPQGANGAVGALPNLPCLLWVNHGALRFANEEITSDISFAGNVAFRQGSEFFMLLDNKTVDILETQGYGAFDLPPAEMFFQPDHKWEGLRAQLEEGLTNKLVYKAESIAGLAEEIGLEPGRLEKTVAEYNSFCAQGTDPMFSKKKNNLISVEKAPFYAVEARAAELCSLGGLRIDLDMQVLSENNRVIPGLYAAGCDASGGLFNNAYVSLEGITIGWAFTSGRLAGESAANYVNGK